MDQRLPLPAGNHLHPAQGVIAYCTDPSTPSTSMSTRQIKLEVGKSYRNREGKVVTIDKTTNDPVYKFGDSEGSVYMASGAYHQLMARTPFDLIKEVPTPTPDTFRICVNRYYKARCGDVVHITSYCNHPASPYRFRGSNGLSYTKLGIFNLTSRTSSQDLIEEVPAPVSEPQAPESPQPPEESDEAVKTEIPAPILNGDTPFYVVVLGDDHGTPIITEHEIPISTTLQAALKRQWMMQQRYGPVHIAECRIIPELTLPREQGDQQDARL